jgi:Ca2+-binding RTX toxin-like protein
MTVTDGGHLSSSTSQTVTVVAAQVAADPFSAGKTALFVNGSTGNDSIKFYSESGGRVKVTDNGVSLGVFAPTGHIIAQAGSGNDTISLAATIQNPAVLYGNAGSDALYGGGGNNILVAGTGTNSLFGGAGADILVGGNGKDVLMAGTGNDLLVGGNWPFATNQSTLAAIDAQWTRTDESFATIVHQLRGVTSGSLAGSNLVSTGNVTNNNGEILVGGPGRDWFLPVNGDVVQGYVSPRDVESGGAVSKPHVPKKK